MDKNICITGLLNKYSTHIAEILAKSLDVFFADLIKLVEFDIINIKDTIEICGLDYYQNLLYKKLKELSTYDGIIAYVNYYLLNYENFRELFSDKFVTIFLLVDEEFYNQKLTEESKTDLEIKLERNMYDIRNKIYANKCDIVVDCRGLDDTAVLEKIKTSLIEYYRKTK